MKPNDEALDEALSVTQIPEENMREYMRRVLTAAYAAQFQSEDYTGLIARARKIDQCDDHDLYVNAIIITDLADALEAVLAERKSLTAAVLLSERQNDILTGDIDRLRAERNADIRKKGKEDE